MERRLGAVIAGGRATRFGSDKALALLDGRALLDHATAALAPFTAEVVVIGRERAVPDVPRAGLGPLGGIAGALAHAAAHDFDTVLTIGCDMPRVPAALLARIVARCPSYCADAPVLGCWPTTLAAELVRRLGAMPDREGKQPALSVRAWARDIGALPIAADGPLDNINTPADLATA